MLWYDALIDAIYSVVFVTQLKCICKYLPLFEALKCDRNMCIQMNVSGIVFIVQEIRIDVQFNRMKRNDHSQTCRVYAVFNIAK